MHTYSLVSCLELITCGISSEKKDEKLGGAPKTNAQSRVNIILYFISYKHQSYDL